MLEAKAVSCSSDAGCSGIDCAGAPAECIENTCGCVSGDTPPASASEAYDVLLFDCANDNGCLFVCCMPDCGPGKCIDHSCSCK